MLIYFAFSINGTFVLHLIIDFFNLNLISCSMVRQIVNSKIFIDLVEVIFPVELSCPSVDKNNFTFRKYGFILL